MKHSLTPRGFARNFLSRQWAAGVALCLSSVCAMAFESPADGVYNDRIDWGLMMDLSGTASASQIPWVNGVKAYISKVNESGGVNGRKLQLILRDDNANPGDAVRAAEELIAREQVDVLSGTFLSHVGLAVADLARQRKMFFLAGEPLTDKVVWQNGNRYTFRLRASTYMQVAMLVPEAAKLRKKRWAIVYPNYEYGQSAAATFKQLLKAVQPDVEFVAEQAPALGKVDAGAVVQALADAKPDAIMNVLFEWVPQSLIRVSRLLSLVFEVGKMLCRFGLRGTTPSSWVSIW